jgi:uncharacterized protein (TIGR02145 family)
MNKDNVFKSGFFHMDTNDVLHILIEEIGGVQATINLAGTESVGTVPSAPIATDATDITTSGFTANWNLQENTDGYYLGVATDSAFTSMVTGYNNKSVGLTDLCIVAGLDENTDYYYRIRGVNDIGVGADSNTITTKTTPASTMTDIDGNVYTTIIIGSQQWTVENLKTTRYRDGVAIPNITINGDWVADINGAYCWYNNDISNKTPYGALYNWYAVGNIHEIAPSKWRVASTDDYLVLASALGGQSMAGAKMKEAGVAHWSAPNAGSDNSSGFTGLPGGNRNPYIGTFSGMFGSGQFWTSTGGTGATSYTLENGIDSLLNNGDSKKFGYSVRCVRDI